MRRGIWQFKASITWPYKSRNFAHLVHDNNFVSNKCLLAMIHWVLGDPLSSGWSTEFWVIHWVLGDSLSSGWSTEFWVRVYPLLSYPDQCQEVAEIRRPNLGVSQGVSSEDFIPRHRVVTLQEDPKLTRVSRKTKFLTRLGIESETPGTFPIPIHHSLSITSL